ncbi:hypothetical protein FT663_00666 [Candidozyma haemuli var. vulneris]|uniref:Protein transport protein SEC31 n=1 Tax=Candidozyma haemuli TaxID=45357 RepID=A0A2V1ANF4_9ASCO|nr:hypothetical protein CXQ85_003447 [[Candida] haemuloni]KAF3990787.1 hypothetical protein FT662_02051 [[Candida] haemuloni var. vulneris]KAF3995288.1 hypothetical protein FT663_00666 [[Candida] haemuloni var. vulneris]PVH19600.1 hypothetical protein CXQ85_003447 [[Candida] haemuloni]
MRIKDITRTSTFAWSSDVIPLLATGSVAGALDLNFSASSTLEIFDVFSQSYDPVFSASLENKFHALAWSKPFGNYSRGLLVGAFETGIVEFWDAEKLIRTKSLDASSVHKSSKHTGAVKCLSFNPHQNHLLVSGGQRGEIFIWDANTFAEPFSPGRAMVPMDEITSVAWNNSVSHILASTSNSGFTSIWDLKAKREVLHLQYNGPLGKADFSQVAWHPTQSTKLITASQSDSCPTIMTWDLRNASEPEKVLQGHEKGVLSLDWCSKDAGLLLSSGKDNSTKLWNPLTGEKLGDYPSATNWTFSVRFAPNAPDVIASASFDGKIVVQTLQDTSPPVAQQVKATDENEFWSNISTADHSQPSFALKQAPQWLKRPVSASFGFGSKLVTVRTVDGKPVININKTAGAKTLVADKLTQSLQNDDFSELISEKLQSNPADISDWKILDALSKFGKEHFLKDVVGDSQEASEQKPDSQELSGRIDNTTEDDFFTNLSNDVNSQGVKSFSSEGFAPSGPFKILDGSHNEQDARLTKLILSNKISDAVDQCLGQGKLLEALVLSLDQNDAVKSKVKSQYFKETNSDVLSRLIYSASSKSVVDLVANADIANWKEIASSIFAYCTDKTEFNSKIVELGDRILASQGTAADRENALECYLAGEALDKVSALWLQEIPSASEGGNAVEEGETPLDAKFKSLSGFVEKLSAYRSLSKISSRLSGPAIEPTCNAVFEFSTMAANSGNFELAREFLSILPENYDGLNAEQERINKATAQPVQKVEQGRRRVPQTAVQNGRFGANTPAKPAFNPLANNAAPAFGGGAPVPPYGRPPPAAGMGGAPSFPGAPAAPAPPAAPAARAASNPYSRAAPSAHVAPAPTAIAPPSNAYAPPSAQRMPSTGVVPPPAGPTIGNTSAPAAPRYTPVQPGASVVSPPAPAQPVSNVKQETDGWNDLPDTFKSQRAARRATPAAAAVVSPKAPTPQVATAPLAPPVRKGQPSAAPSMAPPPPRTASRQASQSGASSPRVTPASRQASVNNKYAPPPSSIPIPPQNGLSNPGSKVATPSAPPKNPYAPSQNDNPPPAKSSFVPPPANNFAAPPQANYPQPSHPPNPYGPPASTAAPPASNPYAPPQASQPPSNPYGPPPTTRGPRGQFSTPASARGSRKPSVGSIAPPPSRAHAAPGTPPVGPPPVGPPPKKVSNQAQAPPSATAQAPQPFSQGPPPTQAPPTQAPPTQAPPTRAPPAQAPPAQAPPAQAPPAQAPPTSAPQAAVQPPPVSNQVKQPPATQPPAQSFGQAPTHATQNGTTVGQAAVGDNAGAIIATFTKFKDQIKPAAPVRYEKHVVDMEKRLNILYGHLEKRDLLSEETVGELRQVASALESKQWGKASSINQEISSKHPNEIGTWHVGVKRLITMAEAFNN